MKLIKNREKSFKIFKFIENETEYGEILKEYEETDKFLYGNIQPISEKQINEEYGITLNNCYNIYSKGLANVLDRLFFNGVFYEILVMKKWDSYNIYTVKEVRQ